MRKTFLLPVLLILLALTFIMVSCENNVYLPEGDTWAVRDMYFSSFSDALAWLMGQGGGTSKGLVESNIQDDMTITLLRNVEEGGEGIKVPKSFTGELCIDFNGHSYQFKKDLDNFFEFLGGVKIDVINGTSIIPGDSASENKALIVDVNTVTVDDHLIEDRRPVPQAVQIGPNGILVINSSSGRSFGEDEYSIDGVFSVSSGGSLAINGGKVHISDINGLAEESDFTIAGGIIINPDRINGIIDTAIEDGGHPENVQQEVYHELGDWVKTDALVHYKACSFCDQHFEEAEHTFTEWQEDENHNYFRDCAVCGRHETKDHIHNLEHHDAVSATCTTSGNTEYWYCGICGKYYSDEAATTQITFDQTVVPKLGHVLEKIARIEPTCDTDGREEYYHCTRCEKNYYTNTAEVEIASLDDLVIPAIHHANKVEHPEKAATCVEDGNEQYWSCPDCGKYFSDEACEHEISYGSWVIHSPGAHDLTEHVYHAATCTEPGNNAYWSCSVCSKYFSDSGATTEIAENSWIIPALGHNKIAHEAHDATCTEAGNSAYWSCDRCSKYFSDEACTTEIAENSWVIPATGHAWSDWITTTEPTCTTSGEKQRVCTHDASHKETETIDPLGHNKTAHAAHAATCTDVGNRAYWSCDRCGKFFSDEACEHEIEANSWVIPATGHQWGEWIIDTEPTCTAAGSKHRVCEHDESHVENESIDALGHNLVHHDAVAPTCLDNGNIEYWQCTRCNAYFLDAEGTQPTTAERIVDPATGHAWGDWITTTEPTCTTSGEKQRVCTHDASHKETETIDPLGHNKTAHAAHDATCTEAGNSAYWSCDRCGKFFSDEACTTEIAENSWVIPATGHQWGEWIIDTEPTCTAAGSKHRVCEHDESHKEIEPIEALGHNKTAHEAHAATCTEAGNSAYWSCDRCGKFFSDEACTTEIAENSWVIPATGHQWGEWIIDTEPTCTAAGSKHRVCENNPQHTEEESIPATGHNMSFIAGVPAKCEETGIVAHYHCDNCSKDFEDEAGTTELQTVVIPVLGHDWSAEWTHGEIDNVHYHWHACSRCDAHGDEAACLDTAVYEHDAEGHWQVCSVCDALLSDKAEHVWDEEVKYDSDKGLNYVECTVCEERLYDELAEVSIGDIVIRTGENPPMGIMTVTEESGGTVLRIRYVAEEGESITALRCRYLSDGEWSPYIEQGADGSFVMSVTAGTEYRIVLEAETAEGRSEYIKVVMSVTN